MKTTLTLLIILAVGPGSIAQDSDSQKLQSIDGLLSELLDQISIKKGESIDTSAVRGLFHPSATLAIRNPSPASVESVSLDEFLTLLKDPYYEEGYEEKELHRVIDEFNGIAQVFQSFYGKDSEGKARGITSYQLAFYDDRWWIISVLWTLETEEQKIPKKYRRD